MKSHTHKIRNGALCVYGHTPVVVADIYIIYIYVLLHTLRFRERNKQFHTGPELSDGNSDLTLVRGASQCVI